MNSTHGESSNLTRTAEKELVFSPVFHWALAPLIVPVFVNRQTVIRSDTAACVLAVSGEGKKKRTCTVWSPPIFKRSSVWLLFLATGEFPALGPGGGAPNGL